MTFLLARINHETNTFSPLPTTLADFEPLYGDAALADQRPARTALGAFIRAVEAMPGARLVTPVSATANPGGTVTADAGEHLCRCVLDAATPELTAILLDLHGAMVSETEPDVEGWLLAELRRKLPGIPIAVALDLHGNVTQRMVDNADIIVGFKTYPHVDMAKTGEHAARLLLAPEEVLDYVVWHEACHLRVADHSDHFWSLVERHCPDWRSHARCSGDRRP